MRQLFFVFVVVVAFATVGFGQQSVFNTKDECLEAIEIGTYSVYQSRFRANAGRVKGSPTFYLPKTSCVKQDVAGGVGANAKWTVQDKTISFSRKNGLIYRTDCGNRVYEIVELEEKVEVVQPRPTPTPVVIDNTCKPGEIITTPIMEKGVKIGETKTDGCNEWVSITRVETQIINPCPVDAEFDGTTSWGSRLIGGLPQAGISAGVSIGITKARGADWGDSLKSGAYGVGLQRVQQAVNASEDGIKLRIPSLGIDQKISKGKNVDLANGVSVRWNGDRVALYRNLNGQQFRCDGFGLKKGSNLGVWTDGSGQNTTPVKTQTQNQIPTRPGVTPGNNNPGNPLPVGNNGPVGGTNPNNGIPTRPTRFTESNGSTNNSVVNSSNNLVQGCAGKVRTVNGQQICY